jgi:3-phosphoglycerate kinase
MKYLSGLKNKSFKGKTCILRVDFNVESPEDAFRLEAALPTIKFLRQRKARVIILSHRGRPKGPDSPFSLKIILPFLRENLKESVIFLSELTEKLPKGEIFLMENLRFYEGEEKNELSFAKKLAALAPKPAFYVNDAFAVSHRKNASVVQLPRLLPAYAGLLMEREIKTLKRVMKKPVPPLVLILGGAKISDKIGVIKNFLKKAKYILIGGATANTFLAAKKISIGDSLVEPDMTEVARKLLNEKNIVLPIDWVMFQNRILDIGERTAVFFRKFISEAATIIWNGPMGFFENKQFLRGSEAVAKAAADSGAFSVAGGGETTQLILRLGLKDKFGFLSTGGGAMLEFLSGKKLPGIGALQYKKIESRI